MIINYRPSIFNVIGTPIFLFYFIRVITFVDQGGGDAWRGVVYWIFIIAALKVLFIDFVLQVIFSKMKKMDALILINYLETIILLAFFMLGPKLH